MKLNVTGVETVEITDPQGLSKEPAIQVIRDNKRQGQPAQPAGVPWDINDIVPDRLKPSPMIPSPDPFRPITPRGKPMSVFTLNEDRTKKWQSDYTGDPEGSVIETTGGVKWGRGMQATFQSAMTNRDERELRRANGNGDKQYNS